MLLSAGNVHARNGTAGVLRGRNNMKNHKCNATDNIRHYSIFCLHKKTHSKQSNIVLVASPGMTAEYLLQVSCGYFFFFR